MHCIPYFVQDSQKPLEIIITGSMEMEEWVSESLSNMGKLTELGSDRPNPEPTSDQTSAGDHHLVITYMSPGFTAHLWDQRLSNV